MKILVLVKQTFDTEEKIAIRDGKVVEDGVNFVINPYDEFAVEEAIKIKETLGADVTVVTVGPARAENALRSALAIGADMAIHVDDEAAFGDEITISKVLAAVARRDSYDLIIGGNMAVDDGAAQVGPRMAEELGIPHVAAITKLEIKDGKAYMERDAEGDTEILECPLPLLVTAQQGLNEPRYPSLPGIMKAKKKPLERLSVADLGLSPDEIKAKTEVLDQFLPPKKEGGRILEGELPDQVAELVRILRYEAKVV